MAARPEALPSPEEVTSALLERSRHFGIPTNLEAIVAIWNDVKLVHEDLDGPGYLLSIGNLGTEILVNKNDPMTRQRFTIAHELGHHVLNREIIKNVAGSSGLGLAHATIERWCDAFATNLLMPKASIEAYFGELQDFTLIESISKAAQHFQVSDEALFIRLWEILRLQVAVVRQTDRTFVVEKQYADKTSLKMLEAMLHLQGVEVLVNSPVFFFSVRSEGRVVPVFGKRLDGASGTRLIVAIKHSNEGAPVDQERQE